jgi:hypothetical protein
MMPHFAASTIRRTAALLAAVALTACQPESELANERLDEMERRFTPGLHSLMVELGMRHATLWFAGQAENWPLTDYVLHEIEVLLEDIEELHPVYRDVQVAALLREMTQPAFEELEQAAERRDAAAFTGAYDRLTTACNHCHTASDRAAIVIQRPTVPPLSNIRFEP